LAVKRVAGLQQWLERYSLTPVSCSYRLQEAVISVKTLHISASPSNYVTKLRVVLDRHLRGWTPNKLVIGELVVNKSVNKEGVSCERLTEASALHTTGQYVGSTQTMVNFQTGTGNKVAWDAIPEVRVTTNGQEQEQQQQQQQQVRNYKLHIANTYHECDRGDGKIMGNKAKTKTKIMVWHGQDHG